MVVLAYGAVWVIVLIYVLRLAAGLRGLRRETDELKRLIEESGAGHPGGG
jgi:CcmD family protein